MYNHFTVLDLFSCCAINYYIITSLAYVMASDLKHSFMSVTSCTTVEMKCIYDYTVVAACLELLVITLTMQLTGQYL